jgi:hypothetical protein
MIIRPTFHLVPDTELLTAMISSAIVLCAVVVPIRNLFVVTSSCDSAGPACCYCNDGLYVQVVCWWCPLRCDCSTDDDPCSHRFSTCRSHMSCCLPAPLFLPMISQQMITPCGCFMSFSFYLYCCQLEPEMKTSY